MSFCHLGAKSLHLFFRWWPPLRQIQISIRNLSPRRRRAGIDACLNRRQSKPWQGAPLLTADDEFVGQGRCGSLSRERKILGPSGSLRKQFRACRLIPGLLRPKEEGLCAAMQVAIA